MTKPLKIALIAIGCVFLATIVWYGVRVHFVHQFAANFQPPPTTVSSAKVVQRDWQPRLQAVGSCRAVNSVYVTSQVSGMIVGINFKSGQSVKEGDSLVRLDDSLDLQTLNNNLAQLQLDRVTYERQEKLLRRHATSKSELDNARAKFEKTEANVESARVSVERKHIKAPFSGKVGIRLVDLGQYVQAGTPIVPLQSLNPLHVDFSVPEQELRFIQLGQPVDVQIEAYPKRKFRGEITAINSLVDTNTRNIQLQATVPNDKGLLYPGVFAWVSVLLPKHRHVVAVPQTAITYSLYGDTVYVLQRQRNKASHQMEWVARQRTVKLGERQGNWIEVLEGLKPDEQVVTSGQIKLFNGSRVVINNKVNPV